MSKPSLHIHTHWQVAQSHPAIQNLPKSMAAPTHGRQESAANLKDNETDGNERQCTTANIGKRGDSGCIQHLVSVSAISAVDNDALRKPRQPILATR
jgi:hypothetical protein